ncbi:MAG: FISUMP domain-containing protein, partial [Candidatus Falkowbacteria bacterium]
AKRVGNAKQIQTALELFYNDNGRYPSLSEFSSGSIQTTTSEGLVTYMMSVPAAPVPADGSCDNSSNPYVYNVSSDGSTYTMSYCIGGRTGGLSSGPKCLTRDGVIDVSCGASCTPSCSGLCSGSDGCGSTCPDNCSVGLTCIGGTCQVPFNCGADSVSYNSYSYPTVQIGTQCWFKENLRTTKYNDNSDIVNITDNTTWLNDTVGAYSWFNNDYTTYGSVYGALYNFYAVNTGKLCPAGWHVPTHDEFTDLERFVCTSGTCVTDFPYDTTTTGLRGTDEGSKLKEAGTVHWNSPNVGADNSSGFTAWGGGFRSIAGGSFGAYKGSGLFWSSTITGTGAWERTVYASVANIYRNPYSFAFGFYVRCIQD